ncbi:MAG: SRPBCC domain-containing protein [Proteobacteria bacterium]|nr:SRPBCC domain-containing protein [Pseudomonadota bacterium]
MSEIFTEIEINASPKTVWDILVDLEKYKEWNPFIRESRGQAVLGAILTCRPEVIKGRIQTFYPVVTTVVPEKTFAWTGHVVAPWFAEGEHIFEIEPVSKDRIRHVHRQIFTGLISPLMGFGLLSLRTREGFIRMNEALKVLAEKTESQSRPH